MKQTETIYSAPDNLLTLPENVVTELNGENLERRSGEAIRLSTVAEDGWPHAAQLSIGEVVSKSPSALLVAIWPESNTAKNLKRDGRLTLSLVSDGSLLEMRGTGSLIAEKQTALNLSVFEIQIEKVNVHRSEYADVTSGVTFRLHEPDRTFSRWRDQITHLKQFR